MRRTHTLDPAIRGPNQHKTAKKPKDKKISHPSGSASGLIIYKSEKEPKLFYNYIKSKTEKETNSSHH